MARHSHVKAVFLLAAAVLSVSCPHAAHRANAAKYPCRIVSLGPINTENIFLLGAGNRLIADTTYCVRPEEAGHREKIGSLMEINIEKIMSLRPDLVLATALTRPGHIKKLRQLGLRVVKFSKPDSFKAVCAQFMELGRLLGLEKRAKEVITSVRSTVGCITCTVSRFPARKVFLQVGSNPLFASVPGSFTNDYIRLAGGVNIAGDQTTGMISTEKVVALNPDVIIIAIMGTETGTAAREKEKWMRFRSIRAVRHHCVHTVNPDIICSPSPLTFTAALRQVASLIHPEAGQAMDQECSNRQRIP